jgi:hypothetical protein
MSEQKKRASKWPTVDFLQAPLVQLKADALFVTFSGTRNGLSVSAVVVKKWRVTQ